MTTANLLDELEGVVCLRARWAAEGTNAAWDELALSAVNCLFAHHATLADMAKRLEAAVRDAAVIREVVGSWRVLERVSGNSFERNAFKLCADQIDAAIDATQEGEG